MMEALASLRMRTLWLMRRTASAAGDCLGVADHRIQAYQPSAHLLVREVGILLDMPRRCPAVHFGQGQVNQDQVGVELVPARGFAGFVRIPAIPGGTYATPMTDRTRIRYASLAVHRDRTVGEASTLYVLKPHGRLVELAMYAKGETYKGSNEWGALSLIGDEWVHVKRLDHVRGAT